MLKRLKHFLYKTKWALRFRLRFAKERKARNVALVVNGFDKGGLEQVVLNLYLGYKKRGYNVWLLSQTRAVGEMADKLLDLRDIYIFDGQEDEFLRFCWRKHINILHYHYNTYMMAGARKMGFRVLYTMHNVYTWKSLPELKAYSEKLASAHRVVAVSSFVRDYYLKRSGAPADNVTTVLNGIDFSELDGRFDAPPVTRKSLGLKDGEIAAAMVASFYPIKHQIGMIGVMERLCVSHPEIRLLLVGNVGDPGYYQAFCDRLENSPARGRILLVPYFDHKYMGQFLRETADIFTLPTLQEGCSNAVLEALYCAKPMVLTEVGNARDIRDEAGCIVVPPAYDDVVYVTQEQLLGISRQAENPNTEALAAAFGEMADHLDAYREKAQKSAETCGKYSLEEMVGHYCDIIENLFSAR